jgi:hypothetical protein
MLNAKWKENIIAREIRSLPIRTICSINFLPLEFKRQIYTSLIPTELIERFHLDLNPNNPRLDDYLRLDCEPCSPVTEMSVYHQPGFPDPILQGQIADTIHGQIHVLFYALNDPEAPRFNVDCLNDGTTTELGTQCRNLDAEQAAMQTGLAPGQVRRGLRLLNSVITTFEEFISDLDHEMYFAQPLYYHNAVLFEHYGFAYAKGRRLMDRIQQGFCKGGEFATRLDGSTPFRMPEAVNSIRLRSWALHDGLLDEPFTDVSMYKLVGRRNAISTAPGCSW